MDWMDLHRKRRLRVAGLMSGTSADGVDVAIVDVGPAKPIVRAFATYRYPPSLRRAIFDLFDPKLTGPDQLCRMNAGLGEVFADALVRLCRDRRIGLTSIDLVASHGQTIWHEPAGVRIPRSWAPSAPASVVRSTLQIGEPGVIAQRTGITTVADFRPRDMAAGGQGAPLVPYADYLLLAHPRRSRAVQNIGGIANVTYLPAGAGPDAIVAFDTGPGNMIIDRMAHHATAGRWAFDRGGKLARGGTVDAALLGELMAHPYLRARPPKSTGRELFGAGFADELYRLATRRGLRDEDLVATATAFTAASIADAYRRLLPAMPDEVIVCGGGARNPVLCGMIRDAVAPAKLSLIDEHGIDADAKEAVSFALLGAATIRNQPNNVPSATGASGPVVLGKIVPGRGVAKAGASGRKQPAAKLARRSRSST